MKPAYYIARAGLDAETAPIMRHNDGSMVIMLRLSDDEFDVRPALTVPMIIHAKRGEAWKTTDPEQEAFAARVVDLLNAAERGQ